MLKSTMGLAAVAVLLTACSPPEDPAPRPQPAPPVPPSPELPITPAKARTIIGELPLACLQYGSLKAEMLICAERQNKPADHEALRTELRDLRWNLQQKPAAEATTQCAALMTELQKTPKPAVCWDLGIS